MLRRCAYVCALALSMVAAALSSGCKDRSDPVPRSSYDASRARRVFRPPPGEVRPVPPHAIHKKGVGPYTLGTPLKTILDQLPRGPRVVLAQIDGVVDYSLVRAESDSLLVGVAQPTGVAFLSVLDREIARTESGVGVGSTAAELREAMGPELSGPNRVMDPRLMGFEKLPNARFVFDRSSDAGRVVAVVVRRHGQREKRRAAGSDPQDSPQPCRAHEALSGRDRALIEAAKLAAGSGPPVVSYGCFTGAPEALVAAGEQLAVVGGKPGKLRRLAGHSAPGLVYAAAVDSDGDARHEIAVVTETADAQERRWSLEVLRLDSARLQRVAADTLYEISATSATWIGANLEDIDLLIEVLAQAESVRVAGLFVHHGRNGSDTVVPLVPKIVPIRRKAETGTPAPAARDAGASPEPGDAGAGAGAQPTPGSGP